MLGLASSPFVYYSLVLFSAARFFGRKKKPVRGPFTPPISNLKPVRGADPEAYDNFASFCRQDYPSFEILFCIDGPEDPVRPVLERLQKEYPDANVRILFGSGRVATNDKVAKLARMVNEAAHEYLVISDSDVRVQPDYLRTVISPLQSRKIGAVTCLYVSESEGTFADRLHSVGMLSDFYASLLVAAQLDGVRFALGPTIATTRSALREFGGYESIENKPADDLWVGQLIAERGYEVELLRKPIQTVPDFSGIGQLLHKRMRWLVVQRHMRPSGHMGFLFTQGLPWALLAVAICPTAGVAACFLGGYLGFRTAITLLIGSWGLRQEGVWRKLWLIPVWDALAFAMWVASFGRSTIRWRDADYRIIDGRLVPESAGSHRQI